MKLRVNREALLKPLQQVAGVVERRQTLPVLSNVLLQIDGDRLSLTGTDLEVEMIGHVPLESSEAGEVTVPARKLVDICRELPENAEIECVLSGQRLSIKAGRFKSTLSTLPADDFPAVDRAMAEMTTTLDSKIFKRLLDRTAFAMAHQDVRYFLNGMLMELGGSYLKTVATDGHRLAMSTLTLDSASSDSRQVIVPRKGVLELQRMLNEVDGDVVVAIGANHLTAEAGNFSLTTKLVDGRFPDYDRVIPKNGDKVILADKGELRQALNRTAILSNEKFRGIRVNLSSGILQLSANNPEQEEAEEAVTVDYEGAELEVGFNVGYVLDVLNVLDCEQVKVTLHDANSSALIEDPSDDESIYVVMPMKL